MVSRIRVHQIEGVTGAVGLVCEPVGETTMTDTAAVEPPPTGAVQVDRAALADVLASIDSTIGTLVFLIGDTGHGTGHGTDAAARIAHLVDRLIASPDHVAAIRRVPAVSAAKRVRDGVVVDAVDRETLNLLRPPEVVDRHALEAALERLGPTLGDVINPTVLAAADGGGVLVVEGDNVDA